MSATRISDVQAQRLTGRSLCQVELAIFIGKHYLSTPACSSTGLMRPNPWPTGNQAGHTDPSKGQNSVIREIRGWILLSFLVLRSAVQDPDFYIASATG